LAGTEYTFYLNPHAQPSFVDAFTLKLAEEYFASVRRPWRSAPFMPGTDTFMADPLIGVPTVWPYSGTGVHTHHNSADTPNSVDARSLRDLAVVNAAFLYFLANSGEREAAWLVELALRRAYTRIIDRSDTADGIAYMLDRERDAIRSVRRIHAKAEVDIAVRALESFAAIQMGRVSGTPSKKDPAGFVIRRKRFGTIPLDDLPEDRREGFPSAAWNTVAMTALFWTDGKRDVAEVARLTRLELGDVKFDFIGYFRFLEKNGYVEFVK
jgi:hypothetical protein